MRIALLSYRSKPHCGGQGVYVRHLSRELALLGHQVEVFSGQPYPDLDDEAVAAGRLVRVQQEGLGLVWWHQESWPVDLLLPVYGGRLRVYQSPWTADDLARLDAVIGAVEPTRRHAGGAGVSPEGIVYRRLLLTYLDQQLATTLSAFPEGMLKLEVQAQPRR